MIRLRLLPFLLFLGSGRPASLGPNNVPSSLAEDCTADSLALKNMTTYQIQIVYTDSPTDDNSVVFQLYNPVIGVDAQCAAYGPGLGVGDTRNDTWYGCFIESRDTRISASFAYDFVLNQVTVNETWVCDSANSSYVETSNPEKPTSFHTGFWLTKTKKVPYSRRLDRPNSRHLVETPLTRESFNSSALRMRRSRFQLRLRQRNYKSLIRYDLGRWKLQLSKEKKNCCWFISQQTRL